MTIQQFIEKAIEGGWDFTDNVNFNEEDRSRFKRMKHLKDPKIIAGFWGVVFLDPEAWKAVGKVEGWDTENCKYCGVYNPIGKNTFGGCLPCTNRKTHPSWKVEMFRMVGALIDGKTIEQYIRTL